MVPCSASSYAVAMQLTIIDVLQKAQHDRIGSGRRRKPVSCLTNSCPKSIGKAALFSSYGEMSSVINYIANDDHVSICRVRS